MCLLPASLIGKEWQIATNIVHMQLLLRSELHEHFLATPKPIKLYIKEVKKQLQVLTSYAGPAMTLKDKWEFVRLTRHAFGRTALVLSGGGALGAFHLVRLPGFSSMCTAIAKSALQYQIQSS